MRYKKFAMGMGQSVLSFMVGVAAAFLFGYILFSSNHTRKDMTLSNRLLMLKNILILKSRSGITERPVVLLEEKGGEIKWSIRFLSKTFEGKSNTIQYLEKYKRILDAINADDVSYIIPIIPDETLSYEELENMIHEIQACGFKYLEIPALGLLYVKPTKSIADWPWYRQ